MKPGSSFSLAVKADDIAAERRFAAASSSPIVNPYGEGEGLGVAICWGVVMVGAPVALAFPCTATPSSAVANASDVAMNSALRFCI
jgi:hypothetical protein